MMVLSESKAHFCTNTAGSILPNQTLYLKDRRVLSKPLMELNAYIVGQDEAATGRGSGCCGNRVRSKERQRWQQGGVAAGVRLKTAAPATREEAATGGSGD
ncbi:hypothetical protein GW17_00003554 [Ensete ventricosum]|nr:hypothetical protein GW17_00003554 [Ensete ventricosum]